MKTHSNTTTAIEHQVETGDILISTAFCLNEDLSRSVILLLDHDKSGSTGIIINKVSNLIVKDVLPHFNLLQPVFYGGEHNLESINCLHNFSNLEQGRALGNGLYYGANLSELESIIHTNAINSACIHFSLGLVQWAPGELEYEFLHKAWWKGKINAEELFSLPYDRLWSYELLKTGHLYGLFSDYADPSLN